jgi:hypothetical protein
MLLHFSQTSCGMIPIFIIKPNTKHPAQNPKKDSKDAKNSKILKKI